MMRIVSLLPSATEIVYALGQGGSVVGVSHECDFPEDARNKPSMIQLVFDTASLRSEEIDALVREYTERGKSVYRIKLEELRKAKPDLIITQELCDVCAIGAEDVLEAVNSLGRQANVLSLNPHTLKDVQADIRAVGEALACESEAERLVLQLDEKAERVRQLTENSKTRRVLCLEWLIPIMNAGHWVPEIVKTAGGFDGLAVEGRPSVCLEWSQVLSYDPEVLVLMPCGFTTPRTVREAKPFLALPHVRELTAVREGRVYATDGHNYFSRSGPRLFDAIRIMAHMVHPELFSESLDPGLGTRVEAVTES
jgi:iron complex transport system substrate-binding protein